MYIVKINNYYVSNIEADVIGINIYEKHVYENFNVFGFETSKFLTKSKIFEDKEQAQSIAEQIGGKVIEYEEKKDIQIDISGYIDKEDVLKFGAVKLNG